MSENPSVFPEHEKLQVVQEQAEAIGEFLDWLKDEDSGVVVAEWMNVPVFGGIENRLAPASATTEALLAKYFHIDLDKLEVEKRQMLKELQEVQP